MRCFDQFMKLKPTMKQKQVFRLFLLPFDNYLFYRHTQSSLRSKRFGAV